MSFDVSSLFTDVPVGETLVARDLGKTRHHSAVWSGHLEIVEFLLEELKCPPDITGQHNATPLQMTQAVEEVC